MSNQILSNLDFNSVARITNLPDGVGNQEPATIAQLNAAVEGLAFKDNVRVAASTNITIASPGANIDGIAMVASDRFLARAQTAAAENGIYIWNGAAVPATRSSDASTSLELESAVVTVDEGADTGTTWRQTTVNFTLGSSSVVWTAFNTGAPAASETVSGIAELATQAETDTGTDDLRIITPLKLANYSLRKKKFTATVGDGSATTYTLTHNFNTKDVIVRVYRNSGSNDTISCDQTSPTVNTVQLTFATAPTTNQFTAVIIA
jgi:hypothetical protein